MISMRSMVWTSECMYRTRMPAFFRYSVRSSAIFLVRVVTSTRSSRAALREAGQDFLDFEEFLFVIVIITARDGTVGADLQLLTEMLDFTVQ